MRRTTNRPAPVCVLGDVDLVRALGLAGLSSVVMALADDPVRFSRHVAGTLRWFDHWTQADAFVDELLTWAGTQPEPPVLIPQTDGDLLLVSRHRERLAGRFRFRIPSTDLVEDLLDKGRFQRLAERLGLAVPRGCTVSAGAGAKAVEGLRFPMVVKPLSRRDLAGLEGGGKAVLVSDQAQLSALWPKIAVAGVDVLAQELVPGPETQVESWHAYVDEAGEVAGEFCGSKIRTWPTSFGHSTALRVTDVVDVRREGRQLVERLGVRGLVKVDWKRDPTGALQLLEVNPRATLWLHPGAVAGVNLAALQYADLTGGPRPAVGPLRPGVTWCAVPDDRLAARAMGVPAVAWCVEVLRCQARSGADWADPAPLLRGQLGPALVRRLSSWRSPADAAPCLACAEAVP